MKRILFLLTLLPICLSAQSISPTQYFDSIYEIRGENMVPGFDSTLIISGAILDNPSTLFVHKVDLNGNLIVEKSISTYTADPINPSHLIPLQDSTYLSIHTMIASTFNKVVINKWNQNLDTLWQKIIDFGVDVKMDDIVEGLDSSIYFTVNDNQDIILTKLNYQGNHVYSKKLDYATDVNHSEIIESTDSNLIVLSTKFGAPSYISKIDTSGSELNSKEITSYHSKNFLQIPSGNLIMFGKSHVNFSGALIKLDKNLDYIDAKTVPNISSIENSGLTLFRDSLIAVSGSYFMEQFSGGISLMDTNFNMVSKKEFYGEFKTFCVKYDELYYMEGGPIFGLRELVARGHYAISSFYDDSLSCGYLTQQNNNSTSAAVTNAQASISIQNHGELDFQIPISTIAFGSDNDCISFFGSIDESESSHLSVYPNPSNGQFTIESEQGKLIENIQIHSTDGRLIYSDEKLKSSETNIDLSQFPKGIYILKAQIGEEWINEKIVLDH